MKNLLTIVSVMLMTFVFFSCEKDTLVTPTNPQTHLSFDTWEDFMSTLEQLTTDEAFSDEWHNTVEITTLYAYEDQMHEEFATVKDETDFKAFSKKYDGYFTFEDRTLRSTYKLGHLKYLLNKKGIVQINGMIQQFLPDDRVITIGDGDMDKLKQAANMETSDEDNHIFITKINRQSSLDKNIIVYDDCDGLSNNQDWKIEGEIYLEDWATPIYNNSTWTGMWNTGWIVTAEATSYNDGWFGWYKRKADLRISGWFRVIINNNSFNTTGFSGNKNNTKTYMLSKSGNTGIVDMNNPNSFFPTLNLAPYSMSYSLTSGNQSANCNI